MKSKLTKLASRACPGKATAGITQYLNPSLAEQRYGRGIVGIQILYRYAAVRQKMPVSLVQAYV